MGFEPIIQADGTWAVGAAGRDTYLSRWRDRPIAYTNSGSMTLSGSSYTRVIPANTLPANRIYLMYFNFSSTGNPWILNTASILSTVSQNGESSSAVYQPIIVHADNGASFYIRMRVGDTYGHISSGLEVQILGNDGRVGSYTINLYDMGVIG